MEHSLVAFLLIKERISDLESLHSINKLKSEITYEKPKKLLRNKKQFLKI